ncbi:hypothetical protein C8J57DRAFT_1332651 [Mycena rebaudengoi]|nr:hypothetical protein C8J57DRAFT_1332651 [Mycena rebaudengoi]
MMLALIPTTLILLISAKAGSAFDPTDQQRNCMANCARKVAPASGCDPTDTACECASSSFASSVKQCITTSCSISASDAQDSFTAQCQSLSSTGGSSGSNNPPAGGSSGSNTPSTGSTPPAGSGNNGKNSAGRVEGVTGVVAGLVLSFAVLLEFINMNCLDFFLAEWRPSWRHTIVDDS